MLIRMFTEFGRPYPWLCTVVCIMILLAPIEGVDVTYYQTVNITKVQSAVKNRAVCLDGSPPAYHHAKGVGEGASNWLVFLEGGGWCDSTESCLNRTQNIYGLGSSNIMLAKNFTGILTNQQQLNPYFYNWNRVFVRYCDGASFTGNNIDHVTKLHYKGAKIFNAIVKDLLTKGMSNATNALLAGCSSGGLSAMLNCDKFRTLLPAQNQCQMCFRRRKDVFGGYSFAEFFHNIVTLHGSTKNLPKACTSKMKPKSLCFYPQYVVPHIKTPLFLINSAYDTYQTGYILAPSSPKLPASWERCKNDTQTCSPHQLQTLKGFRSTFFSALPERDNGSFRGMFIGSCLAHCQSQLQINWDWDPGFRLENKAMVDALGEWFYGKSTSQRIDYDNELPKICLSK